MLRNSPFFHSVALRQHTPLIHFQHDEDGAALRATDLKPRLDRFIIERATGQKGQEALETFGDQHPEYLVGAGLTGQYALDYKLTIKAEKSKEYLIGSSIPRFLQDDFRRKGIDFLTSAPYFADNEKIKNKKFDEARRGVMLENIQLDFFCLLPDLMELVEKAVPDFLVYHNFGTRQSKGFGCFTPSLMTIDEFEASLNRHTFYRDALVYTFRRNTTLDTIFKKIDNEYKILKSGFGKEEAQMEIHFQDDLNIEWEKPTIKKELVKGTGRPEKKDYTQDNHIKYIRALLGVAELYEFPRDRKKVHIANLDTNEADDPVIDRFRSPLTFKVFMSDDHGLYRIYLLSDPIPSDIFDKTFIFYTGSKEGSAKYGKNAITIKTPPADSGFIMKEFLENHVDNAWKYLEDL